MVQIYSIVRWYPAYHSSADAELGCKVRLDVLKPLLNLYQLLFLARACIPGPVIHFQITPDFSRPNLHFLCLPASWHRILGAFGAVSQGSTPFPDRFKESQEHLRHLPLKKNTEDVTQLYAIADAFAFRQLKTSDWPYAICHYPTEFILGPTWGTRGNPEASVSLRWTD